MERSACDIDLCDIQIQNYLVFPDKGWLVIAEALLDSWFSAKEIILRTIFPPTAPQSREETFPQ
jgi:hypothetical protein